jgi:hypothetical protein
MLPIFPGGFEKAEPDFEEPSRQPGTTLISELEVPTLRNKREGWGTPRLLED